MKIAVIGVLGLLVVSVWSVFFVLVLQEPVPIFESRQASSVIRTSDSLQRSFVRFEQSESNPEPSEIINEEEQVNEEILSFEELASSNRNQEILYDFEKKSPVSVDDLLAALGIE